MNQIVSENPEKNVHFLLGALRSNFMAQERLIRELGALQVDTHIILAQLETDQQAIEGFFPSDYLREHLALWDDKLAELELESKHVRDVSMDLGLK